MTRLDRIIEAFDRYDEIVESTTFNMHNSYMWRVIYDLRKDVSLLIDELKQYGCRRER